MAEIIKVTLPNNKTYYLRDALAQQKIDEINEKSKNYLIYYSKTQEEWNQTIDLIAEKDVVYIYTEYYNEQGQLKKTPGLKIGDGINYLYDLPFVHNPQFYDDFISHIDNKNIHVTTDEKVFWNNKININELVKNQNLIFNRD